MNQVDVNDWSDLVVLMKNGTHQLEVKEKRADRCRIKKKKQLLQPYMSGSYKR